MTDIARLAVEVKTGDVSRARKELNGLVADGRRAEQATTSLASSARGLGVAFAGLSAVALGRGFVQQADVYANLVARLKLATGSVREFEVAQAALFETAQRTRVGFEETANLFGSLTRSTKTLGVTQAEVVGVTDSINKALQVSGTSAQSAAAALVQLGQGFASGVLRGEELNSVLEQAPRLAQAIADGLGVPLGSLRELGKEGELTAERVFRALQSSARGIDKEFASLPTTVGQATTQSANAFLLLIGTIDQVSGATASLSSVISESAVAVADLAQEIRRGASGAKDIGLLSSAFLTVTETVRVLLANVQFVFGGIGREVGAIAAQLAALGRGDLQGFRAISEAVKEDALRARRELDEFERRVLSRKPVVAGDDDSETRRRFNNQPRQQTAVGEAAASGRASQTLSRLQSEITSLRERAALIGQDTELQRINAQIKLGAFGSLNPMQQQELRNLAELIDKRNEEQEGIQRAAAAREAATAAITRVAQAKNQEVAALEEGNQSLREEIELLGADELARAAIEIARVRSIRTLKQEELAIRAARGEGEETLQVLVREIELLQQREDLINQRSFVGVQVKARDDAIKAGEAYKSTLGDSIADGILDGSRRGLDIMEIFRTELKAQFARTVLQPIISPVAQAGSALIDTFVKGIAGAIGGSFGGGVPVGNGTGATGDFARFDRGFGGPLATGTNRIEEDGLYYLHKDEAVQPAKYNPAVGGGGASGGPMVVNRIIINEAPVGTQVTERPNSMGGVDFEVLVGDIAESRVAQSTMSGGRVDRANRAAYGLSRQTAARR